MSTDETSSDATTVEATSLDRPTRRLPAHDADVVGFFFGFVCLIAAAIAVAIRTGTLGVSDGQQGVAWIAGVLLLGAGALGVAGTLSAKRRAPRADQPPKT